MKAKQKSKYIKAFGWTALILIILTGAVYLWAWAARDTNLIARGILWGDSDAGDIHRFPSRSMQASAEPVYFAASDGELQNTLNGLPITNPDIDAVDMPFDEYLAVTNTTAFIILHGDQLLYETYFNGADRETLQTSFSSAKVFTSTLVGIALEEGFLGSLDDPITDYLPELAARDPRFSQITIRHLLTMSSGLRFQRETEPINDGFISYYAPNLRAAALDVEIVSQPGSEYHYNDYNPALLGMILERATGMSVSEYMQTRLWQPMGAEGYASWSLDSVQSGFERMFVGLNAHPIDFVKLGWLFLNEGQNSGQQVVSAEWIEEATRIDTSTDPADFYQYAWFIDLERQMYFAEGDKCQFIFVYPQADLVAARFGADCGGTGFSDFVPNVILWVETQIEN